MRKQIYKLWKFITDESGPTAVEYAVMLMLVFLALILVVRSIGTSLNDSLQTSNQAIEDAIGR